MVGVLEVPMAIIAAGMLSDELVLVVDGDPLGVGLERETSAGIFGGDRVAVGVQHYPEAIGGPDLSGDGHVIGDGR